mgnify:CR=1 FL=1|jgi:ribosomal protein S18 acetylase RimI-like enzyme
MGIIIRKANESDFDAILSLEKELNAFEKAYDEVTNTVEQMKSEKEFFHCFVAEDKDEGIIGSAVYCFVYFLGVGKSLYLDNLYIKESFRGQKIGTKLLDSIFKIAKDEKCSKIRWQVINWNKKAIALYKKYDAKIDTDWYNCDFDENVIQNITSEL